MGDQAAGKPQSYQCVVEVLLAFDTLGKDPAHRPEQPEQEIEVVDDQIDDRPAALGVIRVPVVVRPAGEGSAAERTHSLRFADAPAGQHVLDPVVVGEEADYMADAQ